ncbi:MAG: thiolase family protein [Opitutaceae bacterium]|nr:thiolase family protein [Opitutaceae bacterium]
MESIVIVRAKRTVQGKLLGGLSGYDERDLAVFAGEAVLEGIDKSLIDMVVLGNVLSPQANLARQVSRKIGLPISTSAYTVNMVCASGMMAVMQAANHIRLGQAQFVLCGGVESMTHVPFLLEKARMGYRYGDGALIDGLNMGLTDVLEQMAMGETAERLAKKYEVSREAQDQFALNSHEKAMEAQQNGGFSDEWVTFPELQKDESVREGTSLEKLASLKTVFDKEGSVTAGNASGLNDGAAMLLLCSDTMAEKHGLRALAQIDSYTTIGCDPEIMGIGPALAIDKLCRETKLTLEDFDSIELNEAFAAQVLSCLREMSIDDEDTRINADGGAIAMGHPLGASGARILVHLAHRIAQGKSNRGLASLCVGGGLGAATCLRSSQNI